MSADVPMAQPVPTETARPQPSSTRNKDERNAETPIVYVIENTLELEHKTRPYERRHKNYPVYHPKKTSGIDVVVTLLTIPFVGVLVCVAHSLADGVPSSSISEMVTSSRDMEIVFGVAMGAAALSISMAMWILKWRILGTHNTDAYCFMPSLFLVLTILMIFGCGALARHTLKDNAGSHILYAAMAFVSQLLMLLMLDVAAYKVCRYKNWCGKITTRVKLSIFLTVVAFVMLILFGLGVSSKPYYFEFALLLCMYLSSCILASENWSCMHTQNGFLQQSYSGSVIISQRPHTRFDAT